MRDVIISVQPAEDFVLMPAAVDSASFDSVFRDHYPRVAGLLARLTGDRAQAEELAADVFHKLVRHRMISRDREDWVPWLYRVATNAGLDALRSNARRKRREEAVGNSTLHAVDRGNALDGMLLEERRAKVRVVLASLKPREAQLLLLRADGLAYRELAETLGIHPGSVGTMLARAEAEFERRFRARYGDRV